MILLILNITLSWYILDWSIATWTPSLGCCKKGWTDARGIEKEYFDPTVVLGWDGTKLSWERFKGKRKTLSFCLVLTMQCKTRGRNSFTLSLFLGFVGIAGTDLRVWFSARKVFCSLLRQPLTISQFRGLKNPLFPAHSLALCAYVRTWVECIFHDTLLDSKERGKNFLFGVQIHVKSS